jgi:YHS domain-containing protein
MLVLYETRRSEQSFYSRVGEVGYTREGTRLASSGNSGPECVVTGGAGTIKVSHEGKTYYVCCTGCRDAFNDDPAGILADYRAKLAEKKSKPQ